MYVGPDDDVDHDDDVEQDKDVEQDGYQHDNELVVIQKKIYRQLVDHNCNGEWGFSLTNFNWIPSRHHKFYEHFSIHTVAPFH